MYKQALKVLTALSVLLSPIVAGGLPGWETAEKAHASTGTGLKGEYYDNDDFTSLALTRTDATVNFNWGNGAPDASMGVDNYSIRWTGQVQPLYSETYTFYTKSDDGVRLWVNNQLLIDRWQVQSSTEWSGTIALTAGQRYDIKLEYYEVGGGADASLSWSSASQAKQVIPQSQLYTNAPASGNLVDNPGFEDGLVGWLNWDGTYEVVTSDKYSGSQALKLSKYAIANQITLQPNTTYTFSMAGKLSGSGQAPTVGVKYVSNGTEYDETYQVSSNTWTVQDLTFTTPAVIDNAYVFIWKADNTDTFYADDFSVTASGGAGGASGDGLKGEYFDHLDFTNPSVTRVDGTVNFAWGNGSPDASMGVDSYSVRWTGQVQPQYSETYTFYTKTDDGVRLWVNGQLLIDKWQQQAPTEWNGTIALNAGQKYNVKMEYYEDGGGAEASLSWSSASQSKEVVPQSRLFSTGYTGGGGTGGSAIGINLGGVRDFSSQQPFVDVFKSSREWHVNSPADFGELDENGWVKKLYSGQHAITYLFAGLEGHYPTGNYTVLYDGEGTMEWTGGTVVNPQAGSLTLSVTNPTDAGISLKITSVNESNYLRNIRVIMPGFENTYQSNPWHPSILDLWDDFSMLRFMDWQETNHNLQVSWSDRTLPEHATQTREKYGVAVEYMVDLANRLNKNVWFCMPHMANDDYVTQFATYVRDHLDPDLKIYIEYSNEVWNGGPGWGFAQGEYAIGKAEDLGYTGDEWEKKGRWTAHRSKEIFTIWGNVFGGNSRLVRVLPGFHHGGTWYNNYVLEHEDAYQSADAFAIAPYWGQEYGGEKAEQVKGWTMDQFFADMPNAIETSRLNTLDVYNAASAKGLPLIAYEGGQHLAGIWYNNTAYWDDDTLTQKLTAANRDPRMKEMYQLDLDNWRNTGGREYAAFNSMGRYTKWGSWGLIEYQDMDLNQAYKYQAVKEWIADNPKWWP